MPRGRHAAFLLVLLGACSEALNIEPYPQAVFVDPECGACIDAECANEANACAADSDCANLFACAAGCASTDFECRNSCDEQHGVAKQGSGWQAYESCEQSRCAASCVAPTFVDAACASCVEESCDDLRDGCAADATCAPLFGCMARCPVDDWLCRADCEKDHPQGVASAAFEAYDGCRRYLCLDTCIGTTIPPYYDQPGCAECTAGKCEQEARTCLARADCERFFACIHGGDDPNSLISCLHQVYPGMWAGDTPPLPVAHCWNGCAKECGMGEDWGCVGSWSLETPPPGGDPSFATVVHPWLGGPAIAGVTIDVCSEFTPRKSDCLSDDAPGWHATTDANGYAELVVPSDGHFRLGGAVLTQYWYPWVPVLHDTYEPTNAMLDLAYLEGVYAGIAPEFVRVPRRGHIALLTNDCKMMGGAAGVFVDVTDGKVLGETIVAYRHSTPEQGTKGGGSPSP